MTVGKLIKLLKKMPQDLEVAVRDNDQVESELSLFVEWAIVTDFRHIQPNMWGLNEEIVVLGS